jgi:iron complex outermembrane receptor protein
MGFQLNPCKSLKKNKIRRSPNDPSFGVNFANRDVGKVTKKRVSARSRREQRVKMRKFAAMLRAVLGWISSRAGQFFLAAPLVMVPFLTPVAASAEETAIEEVVVTGVRGKPRTVQDSPVPIDVFDQQTIESVNVSSMNDIIRTLVPSFGLARQPISDGATFVRPASVRGLSNDKTLVLVNSKRRHRSMLVNLGSGAQGPDLATIPGVAVKSVEILRDGASALYGSDAIAGVMNFILKDDREGGTISFDTGQNYWGDGLRMSVEGNIGLPLGEEGFLNISAAKTKNEATVRSEIYCESWWCQNPDGAKYEGFLTGSYANTRALYATDPDYLAASVYASLDGYGLTDGFTQTWGDPNTEATRGFFNAGLPISDTVEIYAFGNYSDSERDGGFFYRYPFNGTIEKIRLEDGSIWWPLDITSGNYDGNGFAGGFTPRFFGDVTDLSILGGIRSTGDGPLSWDFSYRFGDATIKYTLKNTINPSLGDQTPTSFRPGDLINQEAQFQADFIYDLSDTASLSFGASYMDETYELGIGGTPSWIAGPYAEADPHGFCNDDLTASAAGLAVIANGSTLDCSNTSDPVYKVMLIGVNGFQGYDPQMAQEYTRDSYGLYAELGLDLSEDLFVQAAVRYEDYSDFGAETVYKVAAKYDLSDTFGVRGSFNTGFRAPTTGQQGTLNISTRLPDGVPVASGIFPASSAAAIALGASPLEPETSEAFSFGITASLGDVDLTLDYYSIEVSSIMAKISDRKVSTDPTAGAAYDNYLALVGANVSGAQGIGAVAYFTSGYDVSVSGYDLVATYPIDSDLGSTEIGLTLGYNEKEFDSDPSAFLNTEAQEDYVNYEPNTRMVVSLTHQLAEYTLMLRGSYWGESANWNGGNTQIHDPLWMTDAELMYSGDEITISFGVRNLFDEYPEKGTVGDTCCGRVYESGSVIPWSGGHYFIKASRDF